MIQKRPIGRVWRLAEIGPAAKTAVPALAKLLDSDQPDVRLQALVALGEIGPAAKDAVPKISKLLVSDPFENVRSAAAFALGTIGQRGPAIRALTSALKSDDRFLRVASAWALLRLEDGKSPAVAIAIRTCSRELSPRTLTSEMLPSGLWPIRIFRKRRPVERFVVPWQGWMTRNY